MQWIIETTAFTNSDDDKEADILRKHREALEASGMYAEVRLIRAVW